MVLGLESSPQLGKLRRELGLELGLGFWGVGITIRICIYSCHCVSCIKIPTDLRELYNVIAFA